MAVSWPPCAPGDLPLLFLLPRGPQCSSPSLPGRASIGQQSCCPSVLQIICPETLPLRSFLPKWALWISLPHPDPFVLH